MMARQKVAQDPCGHITSMRSPALYLPFSQNMCKSRHQHANMGGRGWNLNICFSYQVSRRYGTYMHAIGGAWNWNTATICIIHFNMYRRIKISRTAVLLFCQFLPCPSPFLPNPNRFMFFLCLNCPFHFLLILFIHVIFSPEFVLVLSSSSFQSIPILSYSSQILSFTVLSSLVFTILSCVVLSIVFLFCSERSCSLEFFP